MKGTFFVCRRPGPFAAALIPVTLMTLLTSIGCRDRSTPAELAGQVEVTPAAEVDFADQLARGRSGDADRIELSQTPIDDRALEELTDADEWLEVLQLDAGVVNDAGLESIAALPQLWHLRLRHSPVTDRGLKTIARCRSIQILNLPHCDATAVGVAELAALPELRNLRLGGVHLGADTAASVAGVESLRNVHLIGVPIDDQGLRQIASLPKLRSLYLDDSAVTQSGWDWLFETHPGLHVHVNQKHLDRVNQDHQ
ncbi:Leucine Rich repeats (2 copies) [Stieleria neptunia]|uniref:Leucine Rich repeats (2 copies) n=1 Tax=Stieleria neptunia TaxID=2527979 RepID=A0A518HQ02_9BACT|nr:hypothetical protein [Stieleria neptunia]QDV42924.1 Leucine Rich repeats (2 copies) [Stieleria neptunia]